MYKLNKNNSKVEIEVTIDAQEWEKGVQQVYEDTKGRYNVEGFRKGHAPKKVIEKLSLPKLVYAEDVLISYFAFSYAKLIKNTHLGYYFYHKHTSQEMSISSFHITP